MSFLRRDNALPIVWNLAILLTIGFMLWLIYFGPAQAISLSITGNWTGTGILATNYSGDALNVSILQNGTAWIVNATGMT
jgi:hypothetical protein